MKSWTKLRGEMSPESQVRMDARLQEALTPMPEMLETPKFENEQEEAEWWDSDKGKAAILKGFQGAQSDGTLRRATLKKGGLTPIKTIGKTAGLSISVVGAVRKVVGA